MPKRKTPGKRTPKIGTAGAGRGLGPRDAIRALAAARFELPSGAGSDRALSRAQDLVYDAWEATTAKERVDLAVKALKISPLCADAYVLLATHAAHFRVGTKDQFELWRRGVETGEVALGPAAFEEHVGEFWGILETRPYMRARFGLAAMLWEDSARDEAIAHLQDMLRLNPNDNQGVRYVLAAYLLTLDRREELSSLLTGYREDDAAAWTFTAALLEFRRNGDTAASRALLADALTGNPYVPEFLLGKREMPRQLPDYISPGDPDEAICYADEYGASWTATPDALDWLRREAAARNGS